MSDEDDGKAWANWDVESDDSSSDSEDGWMNVDSDGDDKFDVSDSDDEKLPKPPKDEETPKEDTKRVSTLATTKVYMPLLLVDKLTKSHRS